MKRVGDYPSSRRRVKVSARESVFYFRRGVVNNYSTNITRATLTQRFEYSVEPFALAMLKYLVSFALNRTEQ